MAEVDIAPRFGAELKDGFNSANAWVTNGITWLEDIQQFYRERSAIEKEYSAKLSALAKKYYEKKTRKSSSLSVGDTPLTTPGSLECASMTTWAVQLNTLEARAGEHERFATDMITHLAEPVKHLGTRCEDLRKQHADYAIKLEKERDSTYAELRKTKGRYDTTCAEVESRRKKVDSGMSSNQKAQAAFQNQQSEMHNAKNTYLIDINVTNKQKEKYYHEYVPDLLDSLQDLAESRVTKLNAIWSRAAHIEGETLNRSNEYVKHLALEIPRNNPVLDSMMYVRHNAGPWQEPVNFAFEPSPVWLDDDRMASTENAKTFLRNVLGKRKGQLGELKANTDRKRRELDNAKRIKQNIREGKEKKFDEIECARGIFQLLDQLHEVERQKISAETEVLTVVAAVGDVSKGARGHEFKPQTFKIPTNCDLCGERIWGLSAKGFDCRECGFTCHSKCEMKVPADCPGEQDKDAKRRLKVERQEAAKTQVVEEVIPERQSAAPPLTRSDTINSMNTLSSGYSANPRPSIAESAVTQNGDDDGPPKPKPRAISTTKPRVLAPPPVAYIAEPTNGNVDEVKDNRGKMLYPYQKTGTDEISVEENRDVVILEPDDGSGWMKVRAGLQEGLVPASYVEAQSPSSAPHSDVERPPSTYSASSVSLAGSIAGSITGVKKRGPAVAPKRGAKKLQYVEAMYEYTARSEQEHSIVEGERLVLIKKDSGDGWSDVEKNGSVRSVPANYIQEV